MSSKDEYDKAIAKVRSFADLEDDWDTYGGVAATKNAIDFTVNLLHLAKGIPAMLAFVAPISTGVFITFGNDRKRIDIEVDGDGVLVSWFDSAKVLHGDEYGLNDWRAVAQIVSELTTEA